MPKVHRTSISRLCHVCHNEFMAPLTEVNRGGGTYCSRACYYASKLIPLEEQFQRSIGEKTEAGCILWKGLTSKAGYGVVYSTQRLPQRLFLAHRLAWEFAVGPIPQGRCVLHTCDNPPCINVDHLRVGTQIENIADMATKERQANRKLSHETVRLIRSRYRSGGVSQQKLADDYGVCQTVVSKIIRGKSWMHVD